MRSEFKILNYYGATKIYLIFLVAFFRLLLKIDKRCRDFVGVIRHRRTRPPGFKSFWGSEATEESASRSNSTDSSSRLRRTQNDKM